ncbi:hypothetical protein BCR35DRAFT_353711 [Leucosporidium creatinivorum]|uniref:Proteophosphoglycan ppg4 n=1 Tax=Leucosporidium creatinivorum TaxID=106004 RepID=A0A1Y2ETX2_9BASI|nr:hypothetical protein BCR35DRAFT_353711 [Leucosporidium creatinivorum]
MESSPWASADDDFPLPLPLPRPPSPLPSFGSTSPVGTSGGWGDDGGWGTAVDDYSTTSATGFGASAAAGGLEETTEDLDVVEPTPTSPVGAYGGGWGGANSPPSHSINLQPKSPPLEPVSAAETSPRPPSPPGFAPSPPLSPVARPTSPPPASPPAEEPPAEAEDDGKGWGGYGSPELPPIATLKVEPESPTETRSKGWGDDEWQPPEIPAPLPSFGDAFGGPKPVDDDEDKEEGWGGGQAVPNWSLPGQEGAAKEGEGEEGWEGEASQGLRRGKSIPAALVDGLKVESRQFAQATWPVSQESWGQGGFQEQADGGSLLTSLMEPPNLPPPSPTSSNPPITNDTPLPSLFKLTPTLFPKFQSGLSQTAARSAETLKGTSSTAYRNARFGQRSASGRTSIEGEGQTGSIHGAKGHAGDEFDIDAPGAAKSTKSSWWGASGGQTKKDDDGSVGIPDPAQIEQERNAESPDPAPSALGRLIGRFKRPTNNPVTQAPSRPSLEQQPEPEEWNPRDLDALDAPVSKIAQAKQEEATMDDALSDFFGDTRASSGRLPTKPPVEEFGGLMGAFSDAPRKVSKPVVKSKKALDPFDPFADDDEEGSVVAAAAPAMVPKVITSPTRSSTPRVASPLSRPLTPQSPHRAVREAAPTVASFPSPLAAPQARGVSTIATNPLGDSGDDSFDAFFSSVASSTAKPSSAPPLVSPPIVPTVAPTAPRTSVAQPPPRISTLSPPPRASTISPPASSSSPLSALAPPPPPSQPLNRGGFNIAPPPSAPSSLLNQRPLAYTPSPPPVVAAAAAPRPPPPKPSGSGALSKEDWAFFEA